MTTSRREALGFASFAVAAMTIGTPVAAASGGAAARSARPTAEELERAKRLYGGEFGGGNGGAR
ncbi:hypothetical protein [Sphingomonas alpina]|uniref:Twin-arginine translocation signal domain-containing protein n=1 Tax=Sphingomonas alpina TaxID=653931 RepID=A0A7H0LG55_9SPHN|nr:hypothetical protein [Sphingomonas alpina]QNQ08658.1 hypothetical protein H3Z74_18195 [Sphingomonas alpina]